jgi:hypothetical protein
MIGAGKYTTLASAVETAQEGKSDEERTIVLTKCVDISTTGLEITGKVILDLNGHEIKAANTSAGQIKVTGGDLTLMDSSAEGTGKITTVTDYAGGGTGFSIIEVSGGGNFTMESGTIDTAREDPVNKGEFGVGYSGDNVKNTINIKGGTIKAGWYAISGNGNYQSDETVVEITGGKLISTSDYVIYAPSSATINIKGGTIESHILTGAAGAIAQRSGTINITGGEFICTGTGNTGNYGDGTGGMDNAVISIGTGNGGLYGDATLKIEDGVFTTSTNKIIDRVTSSKGHTATLTITGGTFNKIDATLADMADDIYFTAGYADDDTAKATVLYTAAARAASGSATAKTPTLIVLDEDVTLGHLDVNRTSNLAKLEHDTNNTTKYAFTAGSYNVTYDLNGHNLTYTGVDCRGWYWNSTSNQYELRTESGVVVTNGETLTFMDSSVSGTTRGGTVKYTGWFNGANGNTLICPQAGASVVASNVIFNFGNAGGFFPRGDAAAVTITACDVTANTYAVGTNAATLANYGVVITIKDSKITSTGTLGTGVLINVAGTLDIENSEINGGNQGTIVRAGTATIKNTTITTRGEYAGSSGLDGIHRWRETWSQGTCVPAAALTIGDKQSGSTSYAADADVTLENVTLTSKNGFPALYISGKAAYKTIVDVKNSTITGDIIQDDNSMTEETAAKLSEQIQVSLDENTADNITGLTQEIPSSYLPENYGQVKTGENSYAIVKVAPNTSTSMSYTKGEEGEQTIADQGTLALTYNETATVAFTLPDNGTYQDATVTWAVAAADAEKGVVTVTDNGDGTATVKATKADATGVSVVATLSVVGKPALTTSQSITVTVAKQTPTVEATSTSVTIEYTDAMTEEDIKAAIKEKFTFTATDLYDSSADPAEQGTWEISNIQATDSTGVATATVTFTPGEDSNYNSVAIEGGIEWQKVVPLKLDVDATNVNKTGDTYTGLVITITSDETSAQTALSSYTEALSAIVSKLGESWKASSKGNLYPTAPAASATYGEGKTIINPTTMVAYVNSELAKISGLDAIYRVTAAPKAPDVEESNDDEPEYTQNTMSLENAAVNYAAEDASEQVKEDATKILDLLFDDGSEAKDLTPQAIEENLLKYIANDLTIDLNVDNSGEEDGDQEEGGDETTTTTPEKPQVIAKAVYDVTYTDEEGEEQTYFPQGLEIVLPYPTGTDADSNFVVAHLVLHDEGNTAKNGSVEYFDGSKIEAKEDGLHVTVTSLSTFAVMATDKALNLSGNASGGLLPDTGNAKADNTALIVAVGAVAVTAVVGGVIAYNWDKLPVHKIEGTVVDASGAAVANATVELVKDGKVVKTLTTDANGCYSARVAKGEYTITATVGEATATAAGSTGESAQLAIA